MSRADLLRDLSRRLGHDFDDIGLLEEALTHPSALEGRPGRNYDRLEFLGDRVLGVVIADELHRRFPEAAAGELSRRFSALVRGETLAAVARELAIGPLLSFSVGERQAGGADRLANLENACEAIVAALYLDGGLEAARRFVLAKWEPFLALERAAAKDPKNALQEWAHVAGRGQPRYAVESRSGPDHNPHFRVAVEVDGLPPAIGDGTSKRAAEQAAAAALLALHANRRSDA